MLHAPAPQCFPWLPAAALGQAQFLDFVVSCTICECLCPACPAPFCLHEHGSGAVAALTCMSGRAQNLYGLRTNTPAAL